jgi:HlyD family secretion protein
MITWPRRVLAVSLFLPALILVCNGCNPFTSANTVGMNSTSLNENDSRRDRVVVIQPPRKNLTKSTIQPGRIQAYEVAPLVAKTDGYVEAMLVDIGDRVSEGDVLVRLWIPELIDEEEQRKALVEQAEARLAKAEVQVQVMEAMLESAQSRVPQAQARVGRTEGELARWEAEYERLRELAERGSITPKLVDESFSQLRAARSADEEARAAVDSARLAVVEAEANLQLARSEIALEQAALRVAAANLAQARTMRQYSEIAAPFDGVITKRLADPGHYVQPAGSESAQPLVVVARADRVRVFVDVPESEALFADPGDPAMVRIPALGQTEFPGRVVRTSWGLDEANRSMRLEVEVNEHSDQLRPGMYATVEIELAQRENVLVIPPSAVARESRRDYCYLVVDGKVERRPVVLGIRTQGEVEVVEGIQEGEWVIRSGGTLLRPGQAVEVTEG